MIPDFKTYITESIWSDIQDRSMGKAVRKEDDIDLLDINELCEYLKTIYKVDSNGDINVIEIEGNSYLVICLYEDEYGYYRYIYYDGDYINTQLDVIETLKCLFEFERKFSIIHSTNDFDVACIDIYPKDKERVPVTNKFFIEVLDFILDRINVPLEQKIEKISNIKESIWSDMQDRSAGEIVRKEDDNMEVFKKYLETHYELIDPYKEFQMLSYNKIYTSVGICAFAYKNEDGSLFHFWLNLKDDNGKYTLTINKTAQKYKIFDLLKKEYILKDAKTWEYIIIPKNKKTDRLFFFEVLTFILSHVEYPEISIIRKIEP